MLDRGGCLVTSVTGVVSLLGKPVTRPISFQGLVTDLHRMLFLHAHLGEFAVRCIDDDGLTEDDGGR
jgi:hypothetical protein